MVSVIVPCYNYAHFLGEALESVLHQTLRDWECIIVNDGSPDHTEQVASEFCNKDKRFKYYYKENGGHSSARNYGIKNSSGKYILPLDADDRISESYLEKAVDVFENVKGTAIVTGQVEFIGSMNGKLVMPAYNFRSYLVMNYICITSLFTRIDYDKTNGFDETMRGYEDWDLFISLLKHGGGVVELPFTCLYYRKKEGSVYHEFLKDKQRVFNDHLRLYNNQIDSYKKYFPSPIELVQEYEKLNRIIKAYQSSKTYRFGLKLNKLKSFISKSGK